MNVVLQMPRDHGPFINPQRTCALSVTIIVLCVCLCVCLSTTILVLQAMMQLTYERYQQFQCYKHSKSKMVILTAALELEKLVAMLSKLPGPTHQLVLRMHICMPTV